MVNPADATGLAWLDGELVESVVLPCDDPALLVGRGLFETIGLFGGRLPLWSEHLERLRRGAAQLGLSIVEPAAIEAAALDLALRNRDDVLRLTVFGGGRGGRWLLTSRSRCEGRVPLVLQPALARRDRSDPTTRLKVTARLSLDSALAGARVDGADDALMLGPADEVWETTTGNLLVQLDGRLVTPCATGALLPGIARARLCAGVAVETRELCLADLGKAAGLWVSNAVYGPRPAVIPDLCERLGEGGGLARAWQAAVG